MVLIGLFTIDAKHMNRWRDEPGQLSTKSSDVQIWCGLSIAIGIIEGLEQGWCPCFGTRVPSTLGFKCCNVIRILTMSFQLSCPV